MKSTIQSIIGVLLLLALVACAPTAAPAAPTAAPASTEVATEEAEAVAEETEEVAEEATPEETATEEATEEAVAEEATEEETEAASDGAAFPVTIEHKYGSTTITEQPERIITVGLVDQDALLALGIVPVGTTQWFGAYPGEIGPWALDELESLNGELPEVVGAVVELNMEAIVALQPDLIIGLYSGIDENQYNLLSEIAPTIAQPAEYVDYGIPWDALTLTVGKAVGKSEEAEALVAGIEELFVQYQAEYPEFVGAIGLAGLAGSGDPWIYGPEDPRNRILVSLGFELPTFLDEVIGDSGFSVQLSSERVELLDEVDALVWVSVAEDGIVSQPLYQQLNVYKEGRNVLATDMSEDVGNATSFITVLSIPYFLEDLTPRLADALDGQP